MDFILGTVAPFVFEHSIGPIKRHVTYPFNYKSNIRSLEEGLEELKGVRDRLQHSVDDHERNGKEIEQDVRVWLKDVGGIIEKEEAELVVANETTKKKCCLGFCPNLKTRYQVSKKAEQKAGDVVKLSQKRERFSTLSHTVALQWNGAFSIKDFEAFESRLSDLKKIMNALTRFGVNTVGVHGVGGVGKTTLAREVGRKAKEEKLFDEVVMATVTAEVNVKNIQAQIADVLGLKFDVESEGGRASQLCERLKKEKKLLIILDDLWEKLDLKAVGIPSQDEHDGCKLLLTSRDLELLSNAMDSKENFPIGALAENEAWDLFKKMANNSFQDLHLQLIAKEVAKVCAGLPIAIVTVASSLKSKSLAEWRNALKELHTISSPGLTKIQATIEFSYNKLENKELQSTFLLCSQMGYDATIEDLLKYGMGLDLFDVSTLEEAQDRVYSLVQRLKTFCLLLEGNSKKQLLMHDVVRDAGRRIAFRDHGVIVLNDKNSPKGWVHEDKLKTSTRIWLCSNAEELLEEMQCPKLVFIHIDGNNGDLKIPDNLFKGLDKLRVLSLTSFNFSSLPPSLGLLENLKTLCFYRSLELGDIRIVGELKKLEVLSFTRSNIRELPREIGELTKLKLLDLSDCGKLEVVPSNVLSKLCRLEELYMGGSFDRWETEGGDGASLIELKRLEFLTNLEISIPHARLIPEGIFSEKLRRYRVLIGEGISSTWKSENETLKRLKLKLDAKVNVLEGVLQLLKGTEDLYLYGVWNLLCELDSEGFPRLRHLCLCYSPGVQYIVEVTESAPYVAFPMLESLILEKLVSLEKICQYRPKMQTFNNLRLVDVTRCSKLTYLFSSLVAQGLSQLREITVYHCESMEEIVGEGSIVAHTSKGEATKMITFSQLHVLSLGWLPKLRCFCSNAKQQRLSKRKSSKLLEANLKEDMEIPIVPLFNDRILFPNLEELKLFSINNETLTNTRIEDSFQKLVVLTVYSCANLKYLFSPSLVKCLPQLKSLELSNCEAMEEVTGGEDDQQCMNNEVILFPKLQSLSLDRLPRLERFCKNQEVRLNEMSQNATQTQRPPFFGEMVVFPSLAELSIRYMDSVEKIWHNEVAAPSFCELRKLSIDSCKKLTKVFPSILAGRFQKLKVLSVRDSEWVENIFEVEETKDDAQYAVISFELKELRLRGLPKLKQIWSRDPEGLVTFPNLQSVIVYRCEALKNVFPFSIATNPPLLNNIDMEGCGVEEIVANAKTNGEVAAPSFCELRELSIDSCIKLTKVFPSILAGRFQKLEVLSVSDSEWVENIFEVEESKDDAQYRVISFELKELRLRRLPKLKQIWSRDPEGLVTFPNLQSVIVDRCEALKNVFPFSIATNLPLLNNIHMKGCGVEEIVANAKTNGEVAAPSFCELRKLSIDSCNKLTKVFPSILAGRFQKLEVLSVSDSEWVENIFEVEESKDDAQYRVISFELKELRLRRLPKLKQIWSRDPEGLVTFPNLQSVFVDRCEALKNVFPFSIATNLPLLNNIHMKGCGVEEIVANAKTNGCEAPCFLLPELTKLKLLQVTELTSWYPGMHTLLLPKLKVLYMDRLNGKVVFNSEELGLDGKLGKDSKIWRDHFPANLFPTLKLLHVQNLDDDNWDGFPPGVLQEFHNLEELIVEESALEYLFSFDGSDDAAAAVDTQRLPRLKHLKAQGLSDLRHMIYEQSNHVSHLSLLFRSLETLEVNWCESLVSVAPSSTTVTFQNLTSLILCGCHKLLYIITTLTAKSLTNLVKLEVRYCKMVTEIVQGKEGELDAEEEDKVVFAKLQSLKLMDLKSLTSFCSGNYGFTFPYLNEVMVETCPRMKVFSPGLLHTPKLRDVYFNENGKCWERNLNDTIRKLHNQLVGYEGMWVLKLSEFPDLQQIWRGPLPVKSFIQLWKLEVDECSFFSTAVPFNLMPCLVNLSRLYVSKCDSVEGVFDLERLLLNADDVPNHHDGIQLLLPKLKKLVLRDLPRLNNVFPSQCHRQGVLEFRNLSTLELHNCSSLKNIFTPSMALCLVKLHRIEIRNCIALEEIITKENAGEAVSKVQDPIFPKLRQIVLESLPNLINCNSGDGIVEFSNLKEITVENCPNMKPFISSFLRGQVPRATTSLNDETKEQRLDNHEIQPAATTSLIDDGDDKVAYPELKILRMDWNDTMEEIGHGQVKAEFFCQLQTLEIINLPDDHHTFPSLFLLRFPNVEALTLQNALFKEIILHERKNGEDTGTGALPKLRELTLSKLPNLLHLAKESSSLCSTFQNLEKLRVLDCGKLETLVPSAISFHSLTTLEVSKCHKLLHFMTSTAATSLELLTRMSITECKMLEQIVQDVENLAENIGVSFTKLKCLELHCLPSLTGFSLLNCAFTFPSLKDFVVRECPKMKIFSQGVVTAPKLRRVRLTEGKEKWCWEGSLNATIQKLSMEMNADQTVMQSNQPSSSESSGLDVEAGEPGKNGTSEVLQEIKSPSVTKDLSLDIIITEHIEAEDRGLPTSMDIGSFSQAQIDACATVENEPSQDKTTPPSSTDQTVTVPSPTAAVEVAETPYSEPEENRVLNVCERSASDSCKDNSSEPVVKGFLPEPKMAKIALTNQNPHAISGYDQEEPTLNQNSSTAMEMEKYIDSQVQMGSQEAYKKSDRIPTPSAAPEPAIVSTSESTKRKLSNQELTSSIVSKPSSSPPSFPITASSEKLVNISPASSLLASSSNTPPESCNSVLETNEYSISMSMLKNVLSKPLTEVASSTDRVLLLSALKNLKKCQSHLLNAQQIEAIQGFIDNFDSLVTYHPFYENQIEHIGAFKLSVEDKKKGVTMLKNHCEDLARKSASLDADMEALLKRLREMEEEKGKIREDMEDARGKIAIDDGKLEEADTFILPEFDREQKEVEAKVSNSNSQWAKMRSLFP